MPKLKNNNNNNDDGNVKSSALFLLQKIDLFRPKTSSKNVDSNQLTENRTMAFAARKSDAIFAQTN